MEEKDMESSDTLSGDWDVISSTDEQLLSSNNAIQESEQVSDSVREESPCESEPLEGEQSNQEAIEEVTKEPEKELEVKNISVEPVQDYAKTTGVQDILPDAQDEFHNESNTSSDIDIIDDIIDERASGSFGLTDSENLNDQTNSSVSLLTEKSTTDESSSTMVEEPLDEDVLRALATQALSAVPDHASVESLSFATSTPAVDSPTPPATERSTDPPSSEPRASRPRHPHRQQSFFSTYLLPLFERMMNNTQLLRLATALLISFSVVIVFNTTDIKMETFGNLKENIGALQAENAELRNQIMSKMENEKLLHGLEDQISALKSENQKLSSSMRSLLHQLEEQTSSMRKDHRKGKGPHKEEFEKLKEQINILRIDNDDLQKQLVRMRYGIFAQQQQQQQQKKEEKVPSKEEEEDNATEILSEEIKDLKRRLFTEVEKLKEWKETVLDLVGKFGERQKEEASHHSEDKPKRKDDMNGFIPHMREHLEKTFDNLSKMNIKDMWKYMSGDSRRKIEGAFESVGHYFKKAQEKTKKLFNDYSESNEMWSFLGDLRAKWNDIKDSFIERNYGRKDKGSEEDFANYPKTYDRYKKYLNRRPQDDAQAFQDAPESNHPGDAAEDMEDDESWSWLFDRAEHRENLRDGEEDATEEERYYDKEFSDAERAAKENPSTNWFWRSRRDAQKAANNEE